MAPISYYLATGFPQADLAASIIQHLAQHGYEMTYDWTIHRPNNPNRPGTLPGVIAIRELDGVARGDFLVCLLPGGKGTHVELGAALAANKDVLLIGRALDIYPDGDPSHATQPGADRSDCLCPVYHHQKVWRILIPNQMDPAAYPAFILDAMNRHVACELAIRASDSAQRVIDADPQAFNIGPPANG